jgi:Glycerophosphoryl diester phosphodiesterase family
MTKARCFAKLFFLCCLIVVLIAESASSQIIPLPHAYAHNDYWHKRPLFDALENGFTYIEADVYLRNSKLLVAHRPPFLKLRRKHTIESLYLNPLSTRLSNISEEVQTPLDTIVLMIDIKSNGRKAYNALRQLLENYKPLLSTCEKGKVTIRNLTLVLTGHCPLYLLKEEELRYVFADADLRKINTKDDNPEMFNTASCKYSNLLKWRGKGAIPELEKEHLKQLVCNAHLSGTKVRLWASPENETVWLFLRNCGVDLINTDKLVALKHFFIKDLNKSSQTLTN